MGVKARAAGIGPMTRLAPAIRSAAPLAPLLWITITADEALRLAALIEASETDIKARVEAVTEER